MYDLTIPRRIQKRRESLGLAAYQLANMAEISPSYYSLIESGQKLPSEEVAVRLAQALGDDPDLYRAWVETADDKDLDARAERLQKMQRVLSRSGARLHRRGRSRFSKGVSFVGDVNLLASPLEETASERRTEEGLDYGSWNLDSLAEPREDLTQFADQRTWNVPLLVEGTDPATALPEIDSDQETVAIDKSLLPEDRRGLFAYRVSARSVERVQNLVLPGDVLVFATDPEGVDPVAIYAVRYRSRILLSRITYAKPTLLLRSSDPYEKPLTLEVGDEERLLEVLSGVVVAGIRTWPTPQRAARRTRKPSLGRSGRLDDDGNIVRDCEWKENYGWRPVQRPEDMDYLDDHPGTTVQFRLMRDGRLRHVLEMKPDQWREALGSYHERPTWRRNGYIVAITRRVKGEYTEEFQDRWASFVRRAGSRDR